MTRHLLDFKLLRENGERKHRLREVTNHGAGTDRADDPVGKPLSRHTLITARTALCTDTGRPRGRRFVHCVLTCVGSVATGSHPPTPGLRRDSSDVRSRRMSASQVSV